MDAIHNPAGWRPGAGFPGALERLFAFAATEQYMQAGLVARGLTRARVTVIWQLHRQGPVTQQQIVRTIGVTARNVAALLEGLQAYGFVQRDPHPVDRRALLVRLTDAGAAVARQLATDYKAASARLCAGMPAEQVRQFLATLDPLTARLAPAATDDPGR
ncbi:MarR family transcriptional regulator [Micromonospora phytophila]|uniref:MarR family winged helix-turn-helix transcriptional regulator n=1 Tax=Micromonospora phytophila TaxID=709888 RepID=UPI00202EE9A1|nr:MarR family transcriptional regulator [Micromonospora phytophila]MCM0673398.1 MarR family transcriptional regulator [Micromonospora phytophila]